MPDLSNYRQDFDESLNALVEEKLEERLEKYREQELAKIIDNPDMIIAAYSKKLQRAQEENEAMRPLCEFAETVMQSDDWSEMSQVSKLLARKGWGRNKTFELLRGRSVLRYNNEPYQQYVERGYFKIVEQHFNNPNTGDVMINKKTVVSQRGIDFIRKIIDEVVA